MPHDSSLGDSLARVCRHVWLGQVIRAIAAGLMAGSIAMAMGGASRLGMLVAASCAAGTTVVVLCAVRSARTPSAAARLIERAHPACRNVVVTALELQAHPDRATPHVRARVVAEAAAIAATIPPSGVAPLGQPLLVLAVSACVSVAIVVGAQHADLSRLRRVGLEASASAAATASTTTIVALLQPPPYTGLPPSEIRNPDRLDVLQGTTVRLTVTGGAPEWRIRLGSQPVRISRVGGTTVGDAVLGESGYFALEPATPQGAGLRRLIPVAVSQDRLPVVRIDAPGRDLLLPDAQARVPLAATADDDLGLREMELRYTKVSGTGEAFEFEEGVLPLAVTRTNERDWSGHGQIALGALKLEPGDSIVYRAVARDGRPGDEGLAASDTFFIEIAGPGQVGIEGFDLPPDRERYAMSQQMVVLRIQRLRTRESGLSREALVEETAAIAAEQRAVRANFIFLMGGHVEDEEVEAEQSSEIQEGRLENSSRKEVTSAIHLMSRAEQGLIGARTSVALPPARAAVEALQRAFGRSRYILRAMPVRSRIDPTRRLTGELSAASDWQREPLPVEREALEVRVLLAHLIDATAAIRAGRPAGAAALTGLAEQALAIDPGAPDWQQIATRIGTARDLAVAGRSAKEIATSLERAIAPLVSYAQKRARRAQVRGTGTPGSLLSAWTDAGPR